MRMATPLVTCSRITLWVPSATSGVISTPRLMGPGCMMSTSGLARARRSALSPKSLAYSRIDGKGCSSSRSLWMRSMLTTSISGSTSSKWWHTRAPSSSKVLWARVDGPTK